MGFAEMSRCCYYREMTRAPHGIYIGKARWVAVLDCALINLADKTRNWNAIY